MTGALFSIAAGVLAYEASTHAGLTQRAVLASGIDATLRGWGVAGGLHAQLRLPLDRMSRDEAFRLRERLARVDPAWGGAADARGAQRVLGWLVAGSVLEEAPAGRGRHHFLDPRDGSGLEQPRAGIEWLLSAIAGADGEGTLAGAFLGTNLATLGEPADRWVSSPDNEWGVPAFHRHLRDAVLAPDPEKRQGALSRALLALGAVLHVLQDMASPSHVHNDLYQGHLAHPAASAFDRSSRYERFVALSYGQLVPPPGAEPALAQTRAYYRNLAASTQLGFPSPGSLPDPVRLTRGMSEAQAQDRIREQSPLALPLSGLDFRREFGYLGGPAIRHVVAYRIDGPGWLRFTLDERCFQDHAQALLPRAGGASVALLRHLVRGGPPLRVEGGPDGRTVHVERSDLGVKGGEVVLFWENAAGGRSELARRAARDAGSTEPIAVPAAATRVGALLDGLDARGERRVAARVVDL